MQAKEMVSIHNGEKESAPDAIFVSANLRRTLEATIFPVAKKGFHRFLINLLSGCYYWE